MPGFQQPDLEKAAALNDQASALFAEGTAARETANKYVRDTVLFATVLFLIAVAQRFKERTSGSRRTRSPSPCSPTRSPRS